MAYVHPCFIFGCYFVTQCRDGFAGDGEECELDPDLDAIPVKGLSCTLPNCKKVCSTSINVQSTEFCLMSIILSALFLSNGHRMRLLAMQ